MSFSSYKTFTTDESQCGTADSTDFPITISVTDADLKTIGNGGYVANASGYDIRPFSNVGLSAALTYELVFYNGATGQLEMHVKAPTLSASVNLVSYLAFGDAGISTDGSSSATWETNFRGVWHLGNASTLSLADSSSNAHTLTNVNTATATAGQIVGGANLDQSLSQALTRANSGSLQVTTAFTISAWVNVSLVGWDYQQVIMKGISNQRDYELDIEKSSGKLRAYFTQGVGNFIGFTGNTGITSGSWFLVGATYDGATLSLYRNGAPDGSISPSGSVDVTTESFAIGRMGSTTDSFVDGKVDEARLSAIARSPSWMLADYNNQKASSTFLTWGSRVGTATAALTGTAIGGITEADIVAGGKTVIATLTNDTFIVN